MKQKIYILALECLERNLKEDYIQESGAAKKVGDTTQELLVMQKCKMQQTNKTNPILHRNNTIGVKKLCTQTNWKFYLGERRSRRL